MHSLLQISNCLSLRTSTDNALEQDVRYKVDPYDLAGLGYQRALSSLPRYQTFPLEQVLKSSQTRRAPPHPPLRISLDHRFNHTRLLAFRLPATTWSAEQAAESGSNDSCAYTTECDAFWSLVGLGPGTITYCILRYVKEPDGWWHELLHKLVHGERGGRAGNVLQAAPA